MILVVQSKWNESITSRLAEGALQTLKEKDVPHELVQVPGALEIPLAIQWAAKKAKRLQTELWGAVACGTIVKGDTYHFEVVADNSAKLIGQLSLDLDLPIGNAILAVYTIEQALERAGGKLGNKGQEAAESVLEMAQLRKQKEF